MDKLDRYNFDYLRDNWRTVLDLAIEHLQLSLLAVAIALVVAVPISVLVVQVHSLALPVFGLLDAIYTVPSLAFLAFLIPTVGLGRNNALIVLAAYAQIFLVRNLVAGLRGVDSATLEAARGLGLNPLQVFARVRWPLALPVILAGVRTATVTTIGLATVAGAVGAPGLGEVLFLGVARNQPPRILAGAIAITSLAVVVDLVLRLAESTTAATRARRAVRQ